MNKTVLVNSPAGSGNVFCMYLLRNYLKVDTIGVNHDPYGFKENYLNLFLLRNPYDSIASGIEVYMLDKNITKELEIIKLLSGNIQDYLTFIEESKKDYISAYTFEFLTKDTGNFLKSVADRMQLQYKDTYTGKVDSKQLLDTMNVFTPQSRIPREKSKLRYKIDDLVSGSDDVKEAYSKYVEYRDILQSTEI
jgi:hypothetical protein